MKQRPFSLRDRLGSFKPAINGFFILLKEEHNARIQLAVLIMVVAAGIHFEIYAWEWIAITLVSGLVLSFEAVNSAIENLMDFISPEKHPQIKKVKDITAAAVLIASAAALITGVIIFLPRALELFNIR
ncbi:MAG TPA: diacylglycerol kinase family protein [Bacteroidales bacterium]|nr:diacylglycerol kinase family protein [Bacteroidales bacterium]